MNKDMVGYGSTWINNKTGKHYRYDGINWIDTDAFEKPGDKIICLDGDLNNLLTWDEYCKEMNKQKEEEVKMKTVVQDVDFKGVEEATVVPTVTNETTEIFHFGDFTVARVKKDFSGKKWQGIGVSRQSKDDQRNEKLGDSIAVGRACKAIKMKIDGEKIHHPYMA